MRVAHWPYGDVDQQVTRWQAPTSSGPVKSTVSIPGSKSQTNRALVLAAIAREPSTISEPLIARDTMLMCEALRQLGARIDTTDPSCWAIVPIDRSASHSNERIDAGLAGTVMRFVLPVAAITQGDVLLDGDERARQRPITPLIASLRDLGVEMRTSQNSLPITIRGTGKVRGGMTRIDASASSQFVSALLLSGATFEEGLILCDVGPSLPSQPHIEMTLDMLSQVGIKVEVASDLEGRTTWQIHPGHIEGNDWVIEPDLSNAAPFVAAALVTRGEVDVVGWPRTTTQAGDHLRSLIDAWGGKWQFTADGLRVSGPETIRPIDVDLHAYGELTPAIAAVCALATGNSHLRNIGHLRGHESDRLSALAENFASLGIATTADHDSLTVVANERIHPHGGLWHSFDDHRLATAGAILGLRIDGVEIDDIAATSKTMPEFAKVWLSMLEPSSR